MAAEGMHRGGRRGSSSLRPRAVAAALCWATWASHARALMVITNEMEQRSSLLTLAADPQWCVGADQGAGGGLSMKPCNNTGTTPWKDFKFILPNPQFGGVVRLHAEPTLCLNAPGGMNLQLWHCGYGPISHSRWVFLEDGTIRLRDSPSHCVAMMLRQTNYPLQVTGCQVSSDEALVQFGYILPTTTTTSSTVTSTSTASTTTSTVTSTTATITTSTTTPRPCVWSAWSLWSRCDEACHRFRDRRVALRGDPGGHICHGDSTEYESCTGNECPGDEDEA